MATKITLDQLKSIKMHDHEENVDKPIKEIWLRKDGANTLVWKAATTLWDGSTLADGYTAEYGRASAAYAGLWWAKPRYTEAGGWREDAWCAVAVDLTDVSKVRISWSYDIGDYAMASIGMAKAKPGKLPAELAYSCAFADKKGRNASTTDLDVSAETGTWYIICHAYNTQGTKTDAAILGVTLYK